MKNEITLEKLAAMMQREFSSLREDVTGVQENMATKQDMARIEKRLARMEQKMVTKKELRAVAASWAAEIVRLDEVVKDLVTRVTALEGRRLRQTA